jgi:UDP-N-acetylmuramoylalanine--D-glutamate ligase
MNEQELLQLRVCVIGAARSGVGVARLLKGKCASLFVTDRAPAESMQSARDELAGLGVPFEFGGHTGKALEADLLVVSPGVPTNAQVLEEARAKGKKIVSELEVASWFCPGPIVAVTGTNGKTTTTALIGRMLEDARKPSVVAGNIGVAFSQVVGGMGEDSTAILEVSSFQLDHIASFHPRVSVLLNITPDHLDRYEHSMERYIASKCRIFENQRVGDSLVYNHDDEVVRTEVHHRVPDAVRLIPFTLTRNVRTGAWLEGESMMILHGGEPTEIIPSRGISIKGMHNLSNAMAAALAAISVGVTPASLRATLKNFKGVEHRLEFVREFRGVTYVNDSKGTNVDSVWYALQSYDAPIVLLLGGRDKGNDYARLFPLVAKRVKVVIAIGESAEKVREAFSPLVRVVAAKSMEEAVNAGERLSSPGDVVLLSPACASFDWFENYEHRGRVFKQLVMSLKE